jgi:C-terminal processing protease CtpA/Prc
MFTPAAVAEALSPIQTDRLMAFGQLWGFLKHSHPALMHDGGVWDEAFVQVAPSVLAAQTAEDYRAAVEKLLAQLDDPVTRVISSERKSSTNSPARLFELVETPNALVVHFGAVAPSEVRQVAAKLKAAAAQISKAKALIVDLTDLAATSTLDQIFVESGLSDILVTSETWAPAHRVRLHVGFPAEDNAYFDLGFSSGYLSGTHVRFVPKPNAKKIECVFMVGGFIPSVALALHDSGRARIVAVGNDHAESRAVVRLEIRRLPDNVRVQSRLSELLHAAGSTGFVPDAVVADASLALATAQAWLAGSERKNTTPATQRKRAATSTPVPETVTSLHRRLLAAFRAWAIVEYFFPYKHLMDRDWTEAVRTILPALIDSTSETTYHLAIRRLMAQLDDGHVSVRSEIITDYFGRAAPPVRLAMIDGAPVVVELVESDLPSGSRLAAGDEVIAVAGQPWRTRYDEFAPYVAASTQHSRDSLVLDLFLRGAPESTVTLRVRDLTGVERAIELVRKTAYRTQAFYLGDFERAKREVVRKLRPDVGYVDLTRFEVGEVDAMFERLRETRAIVFDMRGYPGLTGPAIVRRLVERAEIPGAHFNPPVFVPGQNSVLHPAPKFSSIQYLPAPGGTRYTGHTIMLIDERASSRSEHMGLWMRAANGTAFVGSPTAGMNGSVTNFVLPGAIKVTFSGLNIAWPNGDRLQRVGLIPDVAVRPTKGGLAAGRDEVLEAAITHLEAMRARN